MKAFKKWWNNGYPYIDSVNYAPAMEELRQSVKDIGVRKTRILMKEISGSATKLCKLYNGEYELEQGCRIAYVDFKQRYIRTGEYWDNRIEGYFLSPRTIGAYSHFVTRDQPIYNGIPLSLLIEYGEECEDCGVVFVQQCLEHECPSCSQNNVALDYSTRAENILGFEETTDTLFGVELEYEKVTAKQVNKLLKGHAIAKRDGTIQNGVEVVTRPACIKTHKKSLKAFYDQVKVKSHSNTGMHVHVDKRKLSQYQIGFMLQFLNDPDLVSNIETVAGRKYSSNNYCRIKEGTKMTTGLYYDEYSKKIIRAESDKYVPLNTRKPHTIEVRIFSSPETHEEMAAKLDFVNALVKYSSPYSVSVKRLADKFNWDVFIGFIQANRKEFPDFVSFHLKKEAV